MKIIYAVCKGKITDKNGVIGCRKCNNFYNHKLHCYKCGFDMVDKEQVFWEFVYVGKFESGHQKGEKKYLLLCRCEACKFEEMWNMQKELAKKQEEQKERLKNLLNDPEVIKKTATRIEEELEERNPLKDIFDHYNKGYEEERFTS